MLFLQLLTRSCGHTNSLACTAKRVKAGYFAHTDAACAAVASGQCRHAGMQYRGSNLQPLYLDVHVSRCGRASWCLHGLHGCAAQQECMAWHGMQCVEPAWHLRICSCHAVYAPPLSLQQPARLDWQQPKSISCCPSVVDAYAA